jgi:hypothetical protein
LVCVLAEKHDEIVFLLFLFYWVPVNHHATRLWLSGLGFCCLGLDREIEYHNRSGLSAWLFTVRL